MCNIYEEMEQKIFLQLDKAFFASYEHLHFHKERIHLYGGGHIVPTHI